MSSKKLLEEELAEESIEKLKKNNIISEGVLTINYQKRNYLLIFYNNNSGLTIYELDEKDKIYKLKKL